MNSIRNWVTQQRLVEAEDTFSRSLGIRLGTVDLRAPRGQTPGHRLGNSGESLAIGSSYNNSNPTTGAGGTMDLNSNNINLPATKINGSEPGILALSIFNAGANHFLNLEISAMEADGKGKIVSSPRVITADQVKAVIEQGTELPYLVASSSGATSVAFRKANLKLEVTPQITPEGNISLELDVTKDTVGMNTAAGFAVNTKYVKTQVLVDNGGTVVIGGIFEEVIRNDVTKVPILGDIPFLGNLFKRTDKISNKQEMLIFITPKVIQDKPSSK